MQGGGNFDRLVAAALRAPMQGWDFGWLAERVHGGEPSWSYPDLARLALADAEHVLDIDTGGGEVLATLAPLPPDTVALEGWVPNLPVAHRNLDPLGVQVLPASDTPHLALPVDAERFDLVLDRHGRLPAGEIARVLRMGGRLLTQQVGSEDCAEINLALGADPARPPGFWTARVAAETLTAAGLQVLDLREEHPVLSFTDIGALVYQLRAVPWQVPDFNRERYRDALTTIHHGIRASGGFDVHAHRFLLVARREDPTTKRSARS